MKITFWTSEGQAFTHAEGIAKEFKRSTRFDLGNGDTITIKRDDIISIEEDDEIEEQFPADKQYLFKARIDDEQIISIETGKRIAEIYQEDQFCGIYGDMEVWDVSGKEPKRISLLDLVGPILNQKRWMEQEYRDYCDAVNEYGYDFEGRDE